jgi:hypothetical protein
MPTAPPTITLFSHIGGTVLVPGTGDAVSLISCVNTGVGGCPGTFNAPTITPTLPTTANGSFDGDSMLDIASLASPYSVDELITVTLAAGSQINFSASTTLQAVPEPVSIASLGSIVLLISGLLKRKLKKGLS